MLIKDVDTDDDDEEEDEAEDGYELAEREVHEREKGLDDKHQTEHAAEARKLFQNIE